MSSKTDAFEQDLATRIMGFERLPDILPLWMKLLGIKEGARIIKASRMGGSGHKTDVLVELEDSMPLKISAKLSSADYFGNWYSHERVINEFGVDAFNILAND